MINQHKVTRLLKKIRSAKAVLSSLFLPCNKRETEIIASRVWMFLFVFLCSFPLLSAEPDIIASQYIAQALQGKLSQADKLFSTLGPSSGSSLDRYLAVQFRHRFILQDENKPPAADSSFLDQLLYTYRQYWTRSMMGDFSASEGAEWLSQKLYNLLIFHNIKISLENIDEIHAAVDRALERQGIYSDNSFSSPWYDLTLWKTQESRPFRIELTDRQLSVSVVFMDDFQSLGWSEFATLGMTSTGGWAAHDALYCVTWAWNHDSENFRVSFLQHEGRHLVDFEQFPKLHPIDLEYRAKLTELAFASSTLPRILDKFTINGTLNPDSPHAYANYRVVRDLYQALFDSDMPESGNQWQWVRPSEINPVARALLDKHTKLLIEQGAESTSGTIYRQTLKVSPGEARSAVN
jgi:hypothetical protein